MRMILLGLAVASLGAAAYRFGSMRQAPAGTQADAATADGGRLGHPQIFAGGIVEGAGREIVLSFEIAGRIEAVFVHEGCQVEAGDPLMALESAAAQLRVSEAREQLNMASAERDRLWAPHTLPNREPARGKTPSLRTSAHDRDSMSPGVRPAARTELPVPAEEQTIAEARVALAQAALDREQLLLERCLLRAPTAGRVLSVRGQPGELAGPAEGSAAVTLADTSRCRVRAFVEELEALDVEPGDWAAIVVAGRPDREFPGTVLTCSPLVRQKTHRHLRPDERLDVRVREVLIELDDTPDFPIGLPVEVFIDPADADRSPPPAARARPRERTP